MPVYIDLNLGMNRTGITSGEGNGFVSEIDFTSGNTIVGLHAYDGHIKDRDENIRTEKCLHGPLNQF